MGITKPTLHGWGAFVEIMKVIHKGNVYYIKYLMNVKPSCLEVEWAGD
jgi:hypothetical protein